MCRFAWTASVILVALAAAAPAQAEWFGCFRRDFRRNNCWPEPFVAPSRVSAMAPFGVMIAHGWRVQNTLSDHHFDTETAQLNESGELKVREILLENPVDHRAIFVLRANDAETTTVRIRSVQEVAENVAAPGELPEIVETSVRPRNWSADYIDVIGRKYQASTPDPRLPARTTSESGESN